MSRPDPLLVALRAHRFRRGMTASALAAAAGISRQAAYDIDAGRRDPHLSRLRALADALDCDLALVPRTANRLSSAVEGGTQPEGVPA